MASIVIFDPASRNSRSIVVNIESSMIIQDLLGEVEYFLTFSTSARDVNNTLIPKRTVTALSEGAGGTGLDRNGTALSTGKYANLTDCIRDYVAMMVHGVKDEPWTEMAFV
jgi:hypothetical protein